MKHWFTSDTHFGHANIIRYCDRPFGLDCGTLVPPSHVRYPEPDGKVKVDVQAMDRELARIWNETVGPRDTVWHLGDFALGSKSIIPTYRSKLNGRIILIKGNHDPHPTKMRMAGFDEVHAEGTFEWEGKTFYLRHIPSADPKFWLGCEYHLCGHVHDLWKRRGNVINVGVDQWDLRPRSIEELLAAQDEGPLDPKEVYENL